MGLFRKSHSGDKFALNFENIRRVGKQTFHGKAHQEGRVEIVSVKNGEVLLRITGYRFHGEHPLLSEVTAGPWSDTELTLRKGDSVILDFSLDLPFTGNFV